MCACSASGATPVRSILVLKFLLNERSLIKRILRWFFGLFLNVISESDNLWDWPWYAYMSFHSLGVGQDPQLILRQTQDQGLLLQTYPSTQNLLTWFFFFSFWKKPFYSLFDSLFVLFFFSSTVNLISHLYLRLRCMLMTKAFFKVKGWNLRFPVLLF